MQNVMEFTKFWMNKSKVHLGQNVLWTSVCEY